MTEIIFILDKSGAIKFCSFISIFFLQFATFFRVRAILLGYYLYQKSADSKYLFNYRFGEMAVISQCYQYFYCKESESSGKETENRLLFRQRNRTVGGSCETCECIRIGRDLLFFHDVQQVSGIKSKSFCMSPNKDTLYILECVLSDEDIRNQEERIGSECK